jgi:hypothetical protein
MEISKWEKRRWTIEAMDFINLSIEQLNELIEYSTNKDRIGTRILIYDYNTINTSLSLYTLLNGIIDGKMTNLTVVPSMADSLYLLSVGTVGISTVNDSSKTFVEDDFNSCNDTYGEYIKEISQDFAILFNDKVDKILSSYIV